jgi:hypothetical protein
MGRSGDLGDVCIIPLLLALRLTLQQANRTARLRYQGVDFSYTNKLHS